MNSRFLRQVGVVMIAATPWLIPSTTHAAAPQVGGGAALNPVIWRSRNVLDSLGICTHLNYTNSSYGNFANVRNALAYIGLTNIRDGLLLAPLSDPRQAPYSALFSAGYSMSLVSPASMVTPAGYPSVIAAMQSSLRDVVQKYPGQVLDVEGLNEPDLQNDGYTFQYLGLRGAPAVAKFQIDLYGMVKGDPVLASLPVWSFALNSPPYNQVMYEDVYQANPAVVNAFDVGSRGVYGGIWSPLFQMKQQFPNPFDIGWKANAYLYGPWQNQVKNRPGVVKEGGLAGAANGIALLGINDLTVQAKMLPYTMLDTLKLGSRHSFIYELADLYPDPKLNQIGYHFGLYDSNWNAKPVAAVLHNMVSYLTDVGPTATTFAKRGLNVYVPQFPLVSHGVVSSGQTLVAEKSNGDTDVLIWYEPLLWNAQTSTETPAVAPIPVSMQISGTCKSAVLYDPLTNTTTPATSHAAGSPPTTIISVPLPDHLVIVGCLKS